MAIPPFGRLAQYLLLAQRLHPEIKSAAKVADIARQLMEKELSPNEIAAVNAELEWALFRGSGKRSS